MVKSMAVPNVRSRVTALDALRGLAMVIMALDHVRDYYHAAAMQFQPEDLSRTTVAIFLTRWITHFCAPVFMFAAGASAFMWFRNGHSQHELTAYLLKRGLWLVLLELTVLRFAMNFNWFMGPLLLTVLWALGWSMVALGFLSWLPVRVLAVVSVLVIVLHNLLDRVSFGGAAFWKVLHQPGVIEPGGGITVIVAYPLIPWIAVMAAGFCFGHILVLDAATRQKWLLRIGLGLTAAFVLVRSINIYGDPRPWSSATLPLLSFLRVNKYPPSLDFLLMTLGPAILLLAWFYRLDLAKTNPLVIIGRVPLFYFLGHFFLLHLLTLPLGWLYYGHAAFLLNPLPSMGGPADAFPPNYGYSLGTVYVVWMIVVAAMYPLCVWFGKLKQRSQSRWLAYL